jgi:hypothetical protein
MSGSLRRQIHSDPQTVAATTAAVKVFNKGMPKGPFRRWNFRATGTNNSIAGSAPTQYVLKRHSTPIWDLTPAQLRAFLEGTISPIGGSVPATSALRWTLPFDLYQKQGLVGLPSDDYVWETTLDADSSAGELALSFDLATAEPAMYLRMMREQMGVPASAPGFPYEIKTKAGIPVLGWILPLVSATEGIKSLVIYRAPKDNASPEAIAEFKYLDILESQAHYNPEAITNPFLFKPFDEPLDYPDGSYLKIESGTSTAETDEIVPIQLVPANMVI